MNNVAGPWDHMIPTTEEDRQRVHRLAKALGRKPARAVELAVDWAVDNGVSPVEGTSLFRPTKQIHVVLSKNYRQTMEPWAIGFYLHSGLANYWGKYSGGVPDGEFLNIRFWEVDQPMSAVRALQRNAFDLSRDIEGEFGSRFRLAITSLLDSLPHHTPPEHPDPRVSVQIPTDAETRELYLRLSERCEAYRWDVDTLIERRLAEMTKGL